MSSPPRIEPKGADNAQGGAIVVEISDTQSFLSVDHRSFTRLAEAVLRGEGVRRATISLALLDNATIQRINREHLGHDWPTDVISFQLSDPAEPELAGELVVSTEMARAAAAELGVSPTSELARYVVHGLLHLCGYADTCDADARAMRARENLILSQASLADTVSMEERFPAPTGGQEQAAWPG
jgi:probable rRNA maturation factor